MAKKIGEDSLPLEITHYVRDTCLCLHVQRAARALARLFDEALRPYELTNQQFSLLMSLNRPDSPTISGVAELLALDRTTLTANLKPLERRGLVRVAVDHDDKRSRRLSLTAEGKRVLAKGFPIWQKTHTELDARLRSSTPDRLRAALGELGY